MPAHSHLGDLATAPGAPGLPVTALPASPGDGQTVAFQNTVMAEAGVLWLLRYRAASASAYKWEYVGGGWLWNFTEGGEIECNGAYQEWPATPKLTVPLAGIYTFASRILSVQYKSVTAVTGMGLYVGPTGASNAYVGQYAMINELGASSHYQQAQQNEQAAGTVMKGWINGANARRWDLKYPGIGCIPERVG